MTSTQDLLRTIADSQDQTQFQVQNWMGTFEEYIVGGKRIGRYTFATSSVGAANTFTFVLVEDLAHEYPNGTNHWMKGALTPTQAFLSSIMDKNERLVFLSVV